MGTTIPETGGESLSVPRIINDVRDGSIDAVLHVGDFAYDFDRDGGRTGDAFMNQIQPIASSVPYSLVSVIMKVERVTPERWRIMLRDSDVTCLKRAAVMVRVFFIRSIWDLHISSRSAPRRISGNSGRPKNSS